MDGFLSCVFESYLKKELPAGIVCAEDEEPSLYPTKWIETDFEHASRVFQSISAKISPAASYLIQKSFLTCLPQKELYMLRFLRKAYRAGAGIMNHLTDPDVCTLMKAVQSLQKEAHNFTGFIRFSSQNGTLASIITPKNKVLPLIQPHFCSRFHTETFLIYDKTHHMALVHSPQGEQIVAMENFLLEEADEEELQYRALWKQFYKTIAIKGRENPRARMTHIPKRYWADTIELSEQAPRLVSPPIPPDTDLLSTSLCDSIKKLKQTGGHENPSR